MIHLPNLTRILLVITCLAIVGGCGGSGDRPELGTVTGTVTLDGKPLPNAKIVFQHMEKRFSQGVSDENGKYELTYIRDIKGAALGTHSVSIRAKNANNREIVPPKYNSKTTLSVNVEPGHNSLDFNLTSSN